mgnify:CR=1 FL=1
MRLSTCLILKETTFSFLLLTMMCSLSNLSELILFLKTLKTPTNLNHKLRKEQRNRETNSERFNLLKKKIVLYDFDI